MELSIQTKNLLKTVLQYAKKKKIRLYIVGGLLRDIFLRRDKKEFLDIDFCLRRYAISFGKNLAKDLKAGFVVLDKKHGACRIVKKIKHKTFTLDFTDFRGRTLEEDLWHRDFTINTLSIELEKMLESVLPTRPRIRQEVLGNFVLDPYAGRKDLESRIIRIVNDKAFDEDPLRILRSFSFASIFGFEIEKHTLKLIKLKKDKLSEVSFERIRDELFKILNRPFCFKYLMELDNLGILKIILPEIELMRNLSQGPYHHLDVWQHTLETIRQLELLIAELKDDAQVQSYLNEIISSDRRRGSLLKLGALLHDIGKPQAFRLEEGKTKFHGHERIGQEITEDVCQRLKLSNAELDSLRKMVLWHLRPGYLADNEEITTRAMFRYFRDTAQEGVSTLLLSIADQRATKGVLASEGQRLRHERIALDLIQEYFLRKKQKHQPRLINGNDLIKEFKLAPSPLIGKILREIEELQAIGRLKTKKDAQDVAEKIISDGDQGKTKG